MRNAIAARTKVLDTHRAIEAVNRALLSAEVDGDSLALGGAVDDLVAAALATREAAITWGKEIRDDELRRYPALHREHINREHGEAHEDDAAYEEARYWGEN